MGTLADVLYENRLLVTARHEGSHGLGVDTYMYVCTSKSGSLSGFSVE